MGREAIRPQTMRKKTHLEIYERRQPQGYRINKSGFPDFFFVDTFFFNIIPYYTVIAN